MGTELERRGVDVSLPLWSARALLTAPQTIYQIHADYIRAGAVILTANTFRTHRRNLAAAGLGARAQELTAQAVAIARQAAQDIAGHKTICVAGSLAPLADCYSPHQTPPDNECRQEHAEMAQHLAQAGVDVILIETMNTIREAYLAAQAARATSLPTLVSFVCRSDGRLFSGETVTAAVTAVAALDVDGVLINCTPAVTIHQPFAELCTAARALNRPLLTGVYANVGYTTTIPEWTLTAEVSPEDYARLAANWLALGAAIVGACCGATPAHIAAVHAMMLSATSPTSTAPSLPSPRGECSCCSLSPEAR